jgi:UDP-GlcNAc:undecaprenyl-phosphate GlcNAc-1-phosphate transferase
VTFIPDLADVLPLAIGAFAAAAVLAFLLTPIARSLSHRLGVVDAPNARRVNTAPVPRGGGIAVAAAFVVVGGGLLLFGGGLPGMPARAGISDSQLAALVFGVVLAAGLGTLDDRFDLRARYQLLGQVGLAVMAVAAGLVVEAIRNPFGPGQIVFGEPFGAIFTGLWIVGMINSINFIDGLDGLSTGISLIAALTLGLLSLTTVGSAPLVAVLCLTLAGALAGFLRWNFHPASVFTGTAGVMTMGYALAVLSTLGSAKVVVALLVLGVPIIDTFWVIVRRLASGRSPFTPDRGHLHHHLLDLGLGHRGTVLLIYAICASLGAMALVVSAAAQVYAFLGALVGFGLLVFVLARWPREALESATYDERESGGSD